MDFLGIVKNLMKIGGPLEEIKMKRGRRTSPIPPREIRKAFELYLDRITQKEIAKGLNVSAMTIYRWAKRYKWKEKREGYIENWTKEVVKNKIKQDEKGSLFY